MYLTGVTVKVLCQFVPAGVQDRNPFTRKDNLYINYHTLLNLCYLLVIIVAVFPILFIRRWRKKNHTKKQIVIDIFTHVILPIILLLLPYLVGVPLWVVWYFVKDLFFVLVVSAFLLLSTGIYKAFVVLGSKSTED